jgi:PAS domain S-box-containing protein
VTPPSGHAGDPEFERQADALIRRLEALSERVMDATGDPPSPLVAEMLEELSAAVEELEVSTEEIHGQNEALAEAKKQLDLESARYRDLFDLAPDGYLVTDTVGVILESNRAASEMLGTPGHFLNQKPVVVFVDAADRRLVLDHLHDAVTGDHGPVVEFEARFSPPGHDSFSASVHLTVGGASGAADPAGPRVRWLVRDVSRRTEAERLLTASETRYRLIAESAADVVIATDGASCITFASPSIRTVLALDPADLEGQSVADVVHPDDRAALWSLQEDALIGRTDGSTVCRFRCGDGQWLPVEVRIAPFRSPGQRSLGLQYALRDVREREAARVALQEALTREQMAAAALRDADAAKNALLLAASHEFNTPIAAVAGLADLLVRHPDLPGGDIRKMADGLATTAAELRAILTNLLDSERVVGGYVAAERRPFDLATLVAERARVLNGADRAIAPPSEETIVELDPELTTRIVDNLLSNALRHTPKGTAVRVELSRRDDGVLLAVDDSGPGIPDAEKEAVFEPFQRRAKSAVGGLGLGLFVVRKFAEIQGGRAWVEDAPGGGAAFRVLLPDREKASV